MNLNKLAKNTLCIAIVMFSITVSTHIKNSVYKMENELKEYVNRWIILENRYFNFYNIKHKADIYIKDFVIEQ